METTQLPDKQPDMQRLINDLYHAFNFFNHELFAGSLSDCSISIGIKRGARGVYRPDNFVPKDITTAVDKDTPKLDEIMLNPVSFDRDEKHVLSTLVHEMVHQWEQEYGKPAKNGYHNRQWAESMKSIGLYPSDTGEPGGNETGRKVTHFIVDGGLFDKACDRYIEETNFSIEWVVVERPLKKQTSRKRTYRCNCPQPWYCNVSGRSGTCGECGVDFIEDEV